MPQADGVHRQLIDYVQGNGLKLAKYLTVTVGSYATGQALLALFLVLGMSAFWANTLSFLLVVGPNYIGNRYWVWALRSKNSVKGEVLPFWMLNILGYTMSTLAVVLAERAGWPTWAIVATSTAAFGMVWLLKLFVFEKFLFGNRVERHETPSESDLAEARR